MKLDLTKPIRLKGSREMRRYGGQVGELHVILTNSGSFATISPLPMETIESQYENVPEDRKCEFTVTRPVHLCALGAVKVTPAQDGVYLTATDGRRLVVVKESGSVCGPSLVPASVTGRNPQPTSLKVSRDGNKWMASDGLYGEEVEGRFPDTAKVFPDITDSVAVRFDATLLAGIGRVLKNDDNKSYVTLFVSKDDPSRPIAVCGEGGVGALMPLASEGAADGYAADRRQYAEFVEAYKQAVKSHPA